MRYFALFALATLAVAAPIEQRGAPSKSGSAPATSSGASSDCYNNGCGGNYPWKKDIEDEVLVERTPEPEPEPIVEVAAAVMEERGAPSKSTSTTAAATSSGATSDCYNNGCGGNYPWKKDVEDEVLVERAPEPEPVPEPIVEEIMEERAAPAKPSPSTTSSGAHSDCYNNGCGGNYPW